MRKAIVMAFLMGTLVAVIGCGSPAGTGSLRIRWVVGGTTCESANVKEVLIHLMDGEVDINEGTRLYDCGLGAAGVLLEEVPTGTYTVVLEGIDPDGNAFYGGTYPDEVKVGSGVETEVLTAISLALKKALILLTWEFNNGKLCSVNGVSWVEVNAFDTTSNRVYDSKFGCDPFDDPEIAENGGILIEGLKGNEELTFTLFGLDSNEERIFRGTGIVETIPGGLAGSEPQELLVPLFVCAAPEDCI